MRKRELETKGREEAKKKRINRLFCLSQVSASFHSAFCFPHAAHSTCFSNVLPFPQAATKAAKAAGAANPLADLPDPAATAAAAKPVITRAHFDAALDASRVSVSEKERKRFERIYANFVGVTVSSFSLDAREGKPKRVIQA